MVFKSHGADFEHVLFGDEVFLIQPLREAAGDGGAVVYVHVGLVLFSDEGAEIPLVVFFCPGDAVAVEAGAGTDLIELFLYFLLVHAFSSKLNRKERAIGLLLSTSQ